MKNLLLVIGRLPVDSQLVVRARLLMESLGGRVYVYHAVYDPIEEINKYVGLDNFSELREQLLNERRDQLQQSLGGLGEGLTCRVEWCKRPSAGILDWADKISADLIVMDRVEHHGLLDLARTPDDLNLLRKASCPVLLANTESCPVKKVVAAVDSLDHSEAHQQLTARLLDQAHAMASVFQTSLNILSVLPASELKMAVEARMPDSMNLLSTLEERSMENLQQLLDELGIEAGELQVLEGRPDKVIAAEAESAGLLVIGSVSNRGLSGHLLGNTTERVLHRARCDVLVVN